MTKTASESNYASASASYSYPMPSGKNWQFLHYNYRNTAHLDNYTERTDSVIGTTYTGPMEISITGTQRITKTYYAAGPKLTAMRVITTAANPVGSLYWLLSDHLGSVSLTTDASGAIVSQQKFTAWGVVRAASGTMPTDVGWTGQRLDGGDALTFMQARFYDGALGRFISADTVVPGAKNPQGLNRYSYGSNDPIKFIDPSGHAPCDGTADTDQCEQWDVLQDARAYSDYLDQHPERMPDGTFAVGPSVSLAGFGGTSGIAFQVVVDSYGNFDIQVTPFTGASTGWGGTVGMNVTTTDAKRAAGPDGVQLDPVDQIYGPSGNVGFTTAPIPGVVPVAEPVSIGIDKVAQRNNDGSPISGLAVTPGVGFKTDLDPINKALPPFLRAAELHLTGGWTFSARGLLHEVGRR